MSPSGGEVFYDREGEKEGYLQVKMRSKKFRQRCEEYPLSIL